MTVPHDWRDPPTSYGEREATGWYRRKFTLSSAQLKAYAVAPVAPILALGVVARADETFINGVLVGNISASVQS